MGNWFGNAITKELNSRGYGSYYSQSHNNEQVVFIRPKYKNTTIKANVVNNMLIIDIYQSNEEYSFWDYIEYISFIVKGFYECVIINENTTETVTFVKASETPIADTETVYLSTSTIITKKEETVRSFDMTKPADKELFRETLSKLMSSKVISHDNTIVE